MATQEEIDSIVEYYSELLIVQYYNKPKAKAMIEVVVRELLASGILFDIRDAYDIETAVGVQLDTLAKYIGVDRFFAVQDLSGFFAFSEYSDVTLPGDKIGFSDYTDFETKAGNWLTYSGVISQTFQLTDDEFRTIIKLKIAQNNINHSHESIDDSIFAFFGDSVVPFSTGDMEMTYLIPEELTPIITVAIQKEVLPKPIGVELSTTVDFPGIFIVDGRESFEDSVTFTRSTVANEIDATGTLVEKAIDVPRFTYG